MRLKHLLSVFLTLLTLSVGQMWGADIIIDLDLTQASTYPNGFPTAAGTASGTYTLGGYSFTISAPTAIYKHSSGYLFLTGVNSTNESTSAIITFPAIANYKLTEVKVTPTSGGSTAVKLGVRSSYSTAVSGGSDWTYQQGTSNAKTWTLTGTAANTSYKLYIEKASGSGTKNCQLGGLKLTYEPAASCSNKVTVTKSSASNGSFELKAGSASGTTINNNGTVDNCDANATIVLLPSANTHYHVDEVTASNSTSISGPDASGNYTITYTKGSSISTTIGVTFEPDPTYTVTWVAGSNPSFSTQINYAGTALTDPGTPSAELYCPGGKVFKGWTATPIEGEADEAPADLFTSVSGKSIPVNGTTYYAVFATANGSGSSNGSNTLVSSSSSTYYSTGHITGVAGTNKATWTADAFSMTQYKNTSSNAVPLNYDEIRAYQYHSLEFTPASGTTITSIVVNANTNAYASALGGSSISNCTKSVSGSIVTITPTDGTSAITLVQGAQSRINSIVVNYTTGGGTTYSDFATSCCQSLAQINGADKVSRFLLSSYHYVKGRFNRF